MNFNNLAIETEKTYTQEPATRGRSYDILFISNCMKELKSNKMTVCFYRWQCEELKRRTNNKITIQESDGLYYITIK